jgi:hypothetical protein
MKITNDPCTIPAGVLRELSWRFARATELQATRQHVVRHHGAAEWRYLSTTPHERHASARAEAAAAVRLARSLCQANGYRAVAVRAHIRSFN